jgi:flagellar L-ring protein precursor FlgH
MKQRTTQLARWACTGCLLAALHCGGALADSLFNADAVSARDSGLYARIAPELNKGDIIKVRIREQTTADLGTAARTKDESSEQASMNRNGLLGRLLNPVFNVLGTGSTSYRNDGEFKGDGKTTRNSRLNGTVTALVADRLDNGNLIIEGRKRVRVNGEDQTMVVRGLIDPHDVDSNMTIDSDLVADVEIEYLGEGQLSKKTKPNWLSRVVDLIF